MEIEPAQQQTEEQSFHEQELERVQQTAREYFAATGNQTVSMLVYHKHNKPLMSVVLRHEDPEQIDVLRRSFAEVVAPMLWLQPDIVTAVVPAKYEGQLALQIMIIEDHEIGMRTVTYGFDEQGNFTEWGNVKPEKAGPPNPFVMALVSYLQKADPSMPLLNEVLLTTLTKRGHSIFVNDERINRRWQQVAA